MSVYLRSVIQKEFNAERSAQRSNVALEGGESGIGPAGFDVGDCRLSSSHEASDRLLANLAQSSVFHALREKTRPRLRVFVRTPKGCVVKLVIEEIVKVVSDIVTSGVGSHSKTLRARCRGHYRY
jgi:hypothetical protein